ncbi:MAG: bifunctional phosphoglucose/phosphomannose isomerase [Anaerolineae bacterium]|nr:bifunctional phosphoglucose/phosphomannose isomerase [Anaerolineae bacterium]
MNLNDLAHFAELDKSNMRVHIDGFSQQLEQAWSLGQTLTLPAQYKRIERIVIVAVGDAAIAGDMLACAVAEMCNIPIIINRAYDLPAYADGQSTLVIAIDHSGEMEEVLAAASLADARGTKLLAITSAGKLAQQVEAAGGVVWQYEYEALPRAAFGWQIGLLLALVVRLGLVRDLSADVAEAIELTQRNTATIGIEASVVKNPAKRLAGQMIGRTPIIYGAGYLCPVARYWKAQLNNNGKTMAQWEELPDLNHNVIAGMNFPKPLMVKVALVFLVAGSGEHERVQKRWDITRELYLQEGLASDTLKARGKSVLAQMLSTAHFGAYVSYYVAMAYEVDPSETPLIMEMQEKLRS